MLIGGGSWRGLLIRGRQKAMVMTASYFTKCPLAFNVLTFHLADVTDFLRQGLLAV